LPKIQNERTVIQIDTLVSFFQNYISCEKSGVFYPRDEKPFSTYETMVAARKAAGKKAHGTVLFNPLIVFCSLFMDKLRKMYGSKIYSPSLPKD
jgi:hypothetical protein